jgi:hypothetical protein
LLGNKREKASFDLAQPPLENKSSIDFMMPPPPMAPGGSLAAPAKPAPVHKPKSFDDLLMGQSSSSGAWSDRHLVLNFFKDQSLAENDSKRGEVSALFSDSSKELEVWITILALYILANKFAARKSEWQLIANKAKNFLKSFGIDKADNLVKGIKLELY